MPIAWPQNIFPVSVRGYNANFGLGIDSYTGYGGLPRQIVSRDGDSVRVSVAVFIDHCDQVAWLDFFQITLKNGSEAFTISVDVGAGIEPLDAVIVPSSVTQEVTVFGSTISFDVIGVISAQTSGIEGAIFPPELLISLPYSMSYGGSNITDIEESGIPLADQDLKYESIPISVTLRNINAQRLSIWTNFYRTAIDRGSYAFIMPIDTGAGILDHIVSIAGDGVRISTESAVSWSVSLKLTAERMQNIDTYCGKLAEIANCAGSVAELKKTVNQLDTLINTEMAAALNINDYGAL